MNDTTMKRTSLPHQIANSLIFIPFMIISSHASWSQKPGIKPNPYAHIDARALQWPDSATGTVEQLASYVTHHFQTPRERTRAIFIWIANNIQYDLDNMFAINFYEQDSEKIAKPLSTRKGICENYAALFAAVCNRIGIKSVVVTGYTKQRGFVDFIPHAWCAAFVDTGWSLFDPTWGSGYIDHGKFIRKINDDYFQAAPDLFIRSHMPFDYLWQFLYYPVTTQQFYEAKTVQQRSNPRFNFPDSIRAYEALSAVDQEKAEAVRVEKNGLRNSMIFDRLRHLKVDIENVRRQTEADRQNEVIDIYNTALRNYNNGIKLFNLFINYRNDQFKPLRPDPEIQQMIDSADHDIRTARSRTETIVLTKEDGRIQQPLKSLKEAIDDLATHIKEQQDWLTKYFSKSKMGRRSMFSKYTWFGIPLN
jgi:hypothetical protein